MAKWQPDWIGSEAHKALVRADMERLRKAMLAGPCGELLRALSEDDDQAQVTALSHSQDKG